MYNQSSVQNACTGAGGNLQGRNFVTRSKQAIRVDFIKLIFFVGRQKKIHLLTFDFLSFDRTFLSFHNMLGGLCGLRQSMGFFFSRHGRRTYSLVQVDGVLAGDDIGDG